MEQCQSLAKAMGEWESAGEGSLMWGRAEGTGAIIRVAGGKNVPSRFPHGLCLHYVGMASAAPLRTLLRSPYK